MPADTKLIGTHTERRFAVEIAIARQSELDAGLHPCLRTLRIFVAQVGHFEFAKTAVILALPAPVALVAAKVRQ